MSKEIETKRKKPFFTFIMLVGLPGSGKSTYAKNLIKGLSTRDTVAKESHIHSGEYIHISSDAIRGELYGDASCQDDPARVFDTMKQRVFEAMDSDELDGVVYDATNVNRKKRMALLKELYTHATSHGINLNCYCHVIYTSLETCIARAAARAERPVSREVVLNMARAFDAPVAAEGWSEPCDFKLSVECYFTEDLYKVEDSLDGYLKALNVPHENPHHKGNNIAPLKAEYTDKGLIRYTMNKDLRKALGQDFDITKVKAPEIQLSAAEKRLLMSEYHNSEVIDILYYLALCHDLGKIYTKSVDCFAKCICNHLLNLM